MIILGIETSCDETAAAIVEKKDNTISVLSSSIASSEELHKKSGGIIPEVAARKQVESIIPVIDDALSVADLKWNSIDAIAVTYGPGLIGSLLVGVETAKTLAYTLDKPIISVNHLHGHLFVNWLGDNKPELPAVGLVVSGGHTDFVKIDKNFEITYLGGTRDDAAGEAFDKSARLLGLSYPGGPAISKLAESYISTVIASEAKQSNEDGHSANRRIAMTKLDLFPRPMIDSNNLDMSFSGLKTSVLNYLKNNNVGVDPRLRGDDKVAYIAANIQEAIIDTLITKSMFAIKEYKPKSFILSGGVSANSRLRIKSKKVLQKMNEDLKFYVPQPQFSTDNAVMVATTAILKNNPIGWKNIYANPSLGIEE